MVRPHVKGTKKPYGGFDWFSLRVAGLARSIQSKFYIHSCTTRYCLLNRRPQLDFTLLQLYAFPHNLLCAFLLHP